MRSRRHMKSWRPKGDFVGESEVVELVEAVGPSSSKGVVGQPESLCSLASDL
jgi:hypothetical protein